MAGLFENQCVFLTGGSRGIGKEIRNNFVQKGAKVIAPSRSELELSEPQSVIHYIENNPDLKIDCFVHCAAINELAGIEEISSEVLERGYQVNVMSAVKLIQAFVPYMKEKGGKIVFITSLYSLVSREERIAYSASKSALLGVMRTLALELAPYNILVNAVAPGYVLTHMTEKNLSVSERKKIEEMIPTGRFQDEKEIADVVSFLCSEENRSITGQQIVVDGGFLCR